MAKRTLETFDTFPSAIKILIRKLFAASLGLYLSPQSVAIFPLSLALSHSPSGRCLQPNPLRFGPKRCKSSHQQLSKVKEQQPRTITDKRQAGSKEGQETGEEL